MKRFHGHRTGNYCFKDCCFACWLQLTNPVKLAKALDVEDETNKSLFLQNTLLFAHNESPSSLDLPPPYLRAPVLFLVQ